MCLFFKGIRFDRTVLPRALPSSPFIIREFNVHSIQVNRVALVNGGFGRSSLRQRRQRGHKKNNRFRFANKNN